MIDVRDYHDGTKHHFHRFARSLGYLDWASQPAPFRSFAGAKELALYPRPDAAESTITDRQSAVTVGDVLRHALGLSAWKESRGSRWSLRVNPSSGNLHPTEAYVILGSGVYHYVADRHALEQRCAADLDLPHEAFLVALTSIHWREAWKYGERAFRYCQHDLGHAIAAVRIAAALAHLRAELLPGWSHRDIAALTGIDRDEDFVEAEREEPGSLMVVGPSSLVVGREHVLAAVRAGRWTGTASQLSEAHVQWTFIDDIARATEDGGRDGLKAVPYPNTTPLVGDALPPSREASADHRSLGGGGQGVPPTISRALVLQRRSALALDGRSSCDADRFFGMLAATMPGAHAPWDALWWDARIHLALFVHRVDGLDPGLYVLVRRPPATAALKAAMRTRDFLWQAVSDRLPLYLLTRGDGRRLAERVSCDQEIAADGFFSLGMIAEFDASLEEFGPAFYRHLFWESGVVGQVLYLEGEAAGARGTGIGCFYDDPVHDILGLTGHAFQSLYHFTIGVHVEDTRLTTERGYPWG